MGVLFLIVFVDLLGFGLIIPLLPFYARKFDANAFEVSLLFAIYSICQLISGPLLGLMSDRFGRRPVLVLSQLGSVSGYLLLAITTLVDWNNPSVGLLVLYLARAIDGFSGGNVSTAQAYISDITTHDNRAKGMGMIGAAFGLAFAAGPALGGILGDRPERASWPAFAAAGASSIAAMITLFVLNESRIHRGAAESVAWFHPSRFRPVLKNKVASGLMAVWFLSMIAFVMIETIIPLFLADRFSFEPRHVGYFFAFIGVIIIIVQGGAIGRLAARFGEWPLMILGVLMVTGAMAAYAACGWLPVLAMLLLAGLLNATGRSLQTPTIQSLMSRHTPTELQGATFGLFSGVTAMARVIGPLIAGAVYDGHMTAPFIVGGSLTLLATILGWTVHGLVRTGVR